MSRDEIIKTCREIGVDIDSVMGVSDSDFASSVEALYEEFMASGIL